MKAGLIPVGGMKRSEDGAYLKIYLEAKALKGVDVEELVAIPPESLPDGLRPLMGEETSDFLVFGKSVQKQRKARVRG